MARGCPLASADEELTGHVLFWSQHLVLHSLPRYLSGPVSEALAVLLLIFLVQVNYSALNWSLSQLLAREVHFCNG